MATGVLRSADLGAGLIVTPPPEARLVGVVVRRGRCRLARNDPAYGVRSANAFCDGDELLWDPWVHSTSFLCVAAVEERAGM